MSRTKVVALLCTLLLIACGGADAEPDDTADAGTGDTADPDADAGSDEAEADDAGGEATAVTLTLNWVPYGEHAPFYYGLSEGFYSEEGIDLTVQPGGGSGRTIQAVGGGQTDFGWADTPALLNAVAEGIPVKSAGVFLQTGPASIEFFADQDISEPADLVGKTVAGTPGDAMYQTFPGWLEANGLSVDDVNLVNVDPAGKIAALVEGQADAIMGFFHDQAPTIENTSGQDVEVLRYADWGMNLIGTGVIVNDATIEEDPELVEAFVTATQRSWEAAAEDPDAAVEAMLELAEETPPENVLAEQLDMTLELLATEDNPDGAPGQNDEAAWQETIDLIAEYGELDEPGDPSTYWDARFAEG